MAIESTTGKIALIVQAQKNLQDMLAGHAERRQRGRQVAAQTAASIFTPLATQSMQDTAAMQRLKQEGTQAKELATHTGQIQRENWASPEYRQGAEAEEWAKKNAEIVFGQQLAKEPETLDILMQLIRAGVPVYGDRDNENPYRYMSATDFLGAQVQNWLMMPGNRDPETGTLRIDPKDTGAKERFKRYIWEQIEAESASMVHAGRPDLVNTIKARFNSYIDANWESIVSKVSQETQPAAGAINRGPFTARQLEQANEAIRAMAKKPEFQMNEPQNTQNVADLNRLTRELRNRGTKDDASMWQIYDQIFALLRAMGGVVGEPSPTPTTGMYPGPEQEPWMRQQAMEPLERR